jgi:hypothetical protein
MFLGAEAFRGCAPPKHLGPRQDDRKVQYADFQEAQEEVIPYHSHVGINMDSRMIGQSATATMYKKYVRKFEEGTPQMWIDLIRDITEIWTQNSMTGGMDRASTVRALIRGESLTVVEAALQTARTGGADKVEAAIMQEHVMTSMDAVTATVFPHRALQTQRLWMNRSMYKPRAMTMRIISAAIGCINNALLLFPTGTDASKFPETELVGPLEWSLLPQWQEQFDLKGYIPTSYECSRLVAECMAIERHAKLDKSPKSNETTRTRKIQDLINRKVALAKVRALEDRIFTVQNMGKMIHIIPINVRPLRTARKQVHKGAN